MQAIIRSAVAALALCGTWAASAAWALPAGGAAARHAAERIAIDAEMKGRLASQSAPALRRWDELVQAPATTVAPSEPAADDARPSIDLAKLRADLPGAAQASVVRDGQARLPAGTGEVELEPGVVVSVASRQPALKIEGAGRTSVASSTWLFALDGARNVRALTLAHRTAGLHWNPDKQAFVGELLVGLVDRQDATAGSALAATVPVQLLAPSGSLTPSVVRIDRIGNPFHVVSVTMESPDDPFKVDLVSAYDRDAPSAELRVNRPKLALSGPDTIQGWGIEVARITLSGVNTRLRPDQMVTLAADRQGLLEDTVAVGANGVAIVRMRSSGLGEAHVSLAPGIYAAEPKTIRFVPPWAFALSALAGAALGALVVMMRSRGKKARRWFTGLIVGFAGTVMAYVGLRLPVWIPVPEHLVGEAVPFALAFLCALSPNLFLKDLGK